MATWKKVLVSGSAIEGTTLGIDGSVTFRTGSTGFSEGSTSDVVLVVGGDGVVKQVAQSSIAGITTAVFDITGSDNSNDNFNAASDKLVFANDSDISVAASSISGGTSLKLTLTGSIGLISSSNQLTDLNNFTGSADTQLTALNAETGSINTQLTALNAETGSINTQLTSLNAATSSFLLSASVVGTAGEVEVSANGAQGITIGLPDDVEIDGNLTVTSSLIVSQSITADTITITGISLIDNNAAVISGSNIFGDATSDTHQFTGSVSMQNGLTVGSLTASLGVDNNVEITDIVATNSNGHFVNAGTTIATAISESITAPSNSIAADITALQVGFLLSASNSSTTIPGLNGTASFAASGNGLTVGEENGTITYTLNVGNILNDTGVVSGSDQLTDTFLEINGDNVVSGSAQIASDISGSWQGQGFISGAQVVPNLPAGVVSGSITSTTQGIINFPGQGDVTIQNLGTGGDPTFNNVIVGGNLTVNGTTTSVNTTNLEVEDQFILLNSQSMGAGEADKDGGIIIDFGGGSGSGFVYDANKKAWGVMGTDHETGADFLAGDQISDGSNVVDPSFVVTVVSESALNPVNGSSPVYGDATAKSDLGNMHVNSDSGEIWIYS